MQCGKARAMNLSTIVVPRGNPGEMMFRPGRSIIELECATPKRTLVIRPDAVKLEAFGNLKGVAVSGLGLPFGEDGFAESHSIRLRNCVRLSLESS